MKFQKLNKNVMPIVGTISAGSLSPIRGSVRKDIFVDDILQKKNMYNFSAFQIAGGSMVNRSINDGDVVIINKNRKPTDEEVVVVKIKDNFAIRTIKEDNNNYIFTSENSEDLDSFRKRKTSCEILGVLEFIIGINKLEYAKPVTKNKKEVVLKNHRFINSDYETCLQNIKKDSVESIIVDPPYNVANKNTKDLKGRKALSKDFGDWDYFGDSEFLDFTRKWISLSSPKLKDGGNLLIFCKLEYVGEIKRIYEELGFKHHATHIWHKTNPSPQIRKTGFLSSCEAIIWSTKGYHKKLKYTFNFKNQREMHNFYETPICMGKERTSHPTQKPLKVINRLVEIFTNEGDTVLDLFAGSGTTALSCKNLNRKSINVEKEKEYFNIMVERFKNGK